jgi:hypothetical protein
MAFVHHHHSYADDAWPQVLYRAALICLALMAVAAFYFAFTGSTSGTGEAAYTLLPIPPLFPVTPML